MRATIVIAYVNIFSGVSIFRTPVCAVFRVLKPHRTTAAACDVSLLVGVDVYRQYASFFFYGPQASCRIPELPVPLGVVSVLQ
jgi:hypothetical protein